MKVIIARLVRALFPLHHLSRILFRFSCTACLVIFLSQATVHAQPSDDEHQSHHPGTTAPASPSSLPFNGAESSMVEPDPTEPLQTTPQPPDRMPETPAGKTGMMEGMSNMMKGMMGEGGRKEVYPSLMNLPALTSERRHEVERLAEQRIHEGMELLQTAQVRLSHAIEAGDHEAAERALQLSREGNAQVASGVAAHRLLWEGKPPTGVALQWYRRTMGLPTATANPHGFFGLSWYHYLTMAFLTALTAVMIGIYIYRSRRTASLLSALKVPQPASNSAQPGSPTSTVGQPGAAAAIAGVTAATTIHPDIVPSKSNSWTGSLLVARIFQETPQVKTLRLVDPAGGKLPFTYLPGQFLTFTVSPNGKPVKRSYTIASSPTHRDFCEVTVRHENQGLVSGYLHERVHEGELLQVTAPSGKFTFAGQDANSIVLIGGGVGVTPMMSVIRYLTDRSWHGDAYLVYGCKNDTDVIYREELEYLSKRYANLHVTLVVENVLTTSWPHLTGRITKDLLTNAVPDIASRHIHLCGPKPMMEAVKTMLADLGVPANQVETEVFIGKEKPQQPEALISPLDTAPAEAVVPRTTMTFARSHKTASVPSSMTVLEAAEETGVDIDYSCRVGTCGICKVKLLSGDVTMEVDDALEPSDKAQNIILACQAKPKGDVTVDA